MKREIELKYFDYGEKVTCPFCKEVITIPRVLDLIPGSEEDANPTTDLILITKEV